MGDALQPFNCRCRQRIAWGDQHLGLLATRRSAYHGALLIPKLDHKAIVIASVAEIQHTVIADVHPGLRKNVEAHAPDSIDPGLELRSGDRLGHGENGKVANLRPVSKQTNQL